MAPVKKPSHAGKAVVAGGISGAVEICCTYPVSRLSCALITVLPAPHAYHHKDLPYRQHLSAQIEFTKTVLQLSTQKQSAMDVVKNTVRTRGVLGLYKVAPSRQPKP